MEETMENVRNYVDVRLLTCWNGRYDAKAMIAKSNFHSCNIFSENLVAIEMRKLEVKFGKPIYVGMYILDILKYICMIFTMSMYMHRCFAINVKLCMYVLLLYRY